MIYLNVVWCHHSKLPENHWLFYGLKPQFYCKQFRFALLHRVLERKGLNHCCRSEGVVATNLRIASAVGMLKNQHWKCPSGRPLSSNSEVLKGRNFVVVVCIYILFLFFLESLGNRSIVQSWGDSDVLWSFDRAVLQQCACLSRVLRCSGLWS